jgi:hypothetical protein
MSVRRRRWLPPVLTAVAALVLAGLTPAGTAEAAPTGWLVRSMCASPRTGHASCHALKLVHGRVLAGETAVRRPAGGGGPSGGYSPYRLSKAYGLNPNAAAGARQTVAIVDAFRDPSVRADLAAFDRHYHLRKETSSSFRVVNQHGHTSPLPHADAGWAGETGLDVQAVRGICHKCRILLVEARSDSDADLAAAVNTAARLGADEISNSYGGTENDPFNTRSVVKAYDHPGVVITASTGDAGWYDWDYVNEYGDPTNTPEIPAAYKTVVGVGGTSLYLDSAGRRLGERAWNGDGPADEDGGSVSASLGASGGGCSTLYRAPLWQARTAGYSGLGCGARRSSVDVAAVADPATGYDVFQTYPASTGSWSTVGGTSLSSPLIAAMWALAGGAGGVRYPALSLYGHFAHPSIRHVHDITVGGTGLCGGASVATCRAAWKTNPNETEHGLVDCAFPAHGSAVLANRYQCYARRGYDGVAGVGTPAGTSVFKAMRPTARFIRPAKVRLGAKVRYSAVHSSDPFPGGRITRYVWHWGDGHVTRTAHRVATHRFRAGGKRTVTLQVVDNFGRSDTATRRFRVHG